MSYRVIIHPDLAPAFRKLRAKSPERYEHLKKKITFLVENPESGKPVNAPRKGQWRTHIGHFVLIYEIDQKENTIVLLQFDHHDQVYN